MIKLTAVTDIPKKRSYVGIQPLITQFAESDIPMVRIDHDGHYTSPTVCSSVWRNAVIRSKIPNIQVLLRNGEVYLAKISGPTPILRVETEYPSKDEAEMKGLRRS